jgi:hypothetical protein
MKAGGEANRRTTSKRRTAEPLDTRASDSLAADRVDLAEELTGSGLSKRARGSDCKRTLPSSATMRFVEREVPLAIR